MIGMQAQERTTQQAPVAIVGIACRLPGAADPGAFWDLVREGRDAVREIPPDRWRTAGIFDADPLRPGGIAGRHAGLLKQVDGFDWRAFRISPREARYMDPQHRLLLEVAWEAFEDAGLPFEQVAGSRVGVFAGISWNDYLRLQTRDWARLDGYSAPGGLLAFAANRLSYQFDLRGPSLAIDASCASSLTAVHYACHSLRLGESSLALVAGVCLMLSPDSSILMSRTGLLSRQGQCRHLDKDADGFVRGEGAGAVVLKLLSQVTPEDRVYAVIRGSALSHNGRNEWIVSPSVAGQEAAIRSALRESGVDPADVDYLELNGTSSLKGDAVEVEAAGRVVGRASRRERPCELGTVKVNIGNLDAASGIASLLKVALALFHRELPPNLHLQKLNPEIPLEELGFAVRSQAAPWPEASRPRLAGINSISFGGVNVHLLIEEASLPERAPGGSQAFLLPLSAHSAESLSAQAAQMALLLRGDAPPALADLCYTASVRRSHHAHRLAVVGSSAAEIAAALEAWCRHAAPSSGAAGASSEAPSPTPMSFPSGRPDAPGIDPLPPERRSQLEMLEGLAAHYVSGGDVRWEPLNPPGARCISLPPYAWQRERLWLEWLNVERISTPPESPSFARPEERASESGSELIPKDLGAEQGDDPGVPSREALTALGEQERKAWLDRWLESLVQEALGHPEARLAPGVSLLELGLDSMMAIELVHRIQATLQVDLTAVDVLKAPMIDRLAALLLERLFQDDAPVSSIASHFPNHDEANCSAQGDEDLPLSFSQQNLWFAMPEGVGGPAWNLFYGFRLIGALDHTALKHTLELLEQRHASLRASFPLIDGRPRQRIARGRRIHLELLNFEALPAGDQDDEVTWLAEEECRRVFDLERGPVWRAKLIRLSEGEHLLFLSFHHLILDLWSFGVLLRELSLVYSAMRRGRASPLPTPLASYQDFVHWEQALLDDPRCEVERYWTRQLDGCPGGLLLADAGAQGSGTPQSEGAYRYFGFSRPLSEALQGFCQREGVTLNVTLLTAFAALLHVLTGQEDLPVITFTSRRSLNLFEGVVGFLTNALVVRIDLSGDPTVQTMIERVRATLLEAFANDGAPLGLQVRKLLEDQGGRSLPLVSQCYFLFQPFPWPSLELEGLETKLIDITHLDNGAARADLEWVLWQHPEGIRGFLTYRRAAFDAAKVVSMGEQFQCLVARFLEGPEQRLSSLAVP